jgi:hypothetical protein
VSKMSVEESVRTLTERKLNVPDRIIVFDGTESRAVEFKSCETLEYLKLCVSLNFYSEEGTI